MDIPMRNPRRGQATGTTLGVGARQSNAKWQLSRLNLLRQAGRIRLAWRFILVAVLVCLASIVWLSQTSTIVSYGYNIEKLDKQETLLNRQAQQLQSQLAQYENLSRIEEEARTKLGMLPVTRTVYLRVPIAPAQAVADFSTNPKLAPVNNWWRELTEMLPRPFRGSAPLDPRLIKN